MSNRLLRRAFLGALACALTASAQKVEDLEKRITEFDLPNGLHFIILERHTAPVFAGLSFVNAGAANDPAGKAGIAHMFEHMAFKGTTVIGTKDYAKEKPILDEMDKIGDELAAEYMKGDAADKAKMKAFKDKLAQLQEEDRKYVVKDELDRYYSENGGEFLNANTGTDTT